MTLTAQTDPAAAATLLEATVAQHPSNAQAHYALGVAYGRLAERASIFRQASLARHARDEFLRAVQLDPNQIEARYSLVEYYVLAPAILGGSDDKAREQAKEIASRDPAAGHRAFAFIAVHRKNYKTAAVELNAAVGLDPTDMPSWFEIGRVAALSGVNLHRGEEALRKYLDYTPSEDEPGHDRALYWLARIYELEGRRADAQRLMARAAATAR